MAQSACGGQEKLAEESVWQVQRLRSPERLPSGRYLSAQYLGRGICKPFGWCLSVSPLKAQPGAMGLCAPLRCSSKWEEFPIPIRLPRMMSPGLEVENLVDQGRLGGHRRGIHDSRPLEPHHSHPWLRAAQSVPHPGWRFPFHCAAPWLPSARRQFP